VGIVVAAVILLIIAIIIGVYYKKIKDYLSCVDHVDNCDIYGNTGQHMDARFD
jgi:hypothetical protein